LRDAERLRRDAREIFNWALEAVDARRAVLAAVRSEGPRLSVCGAEFDLGPRGGRIYSVALGKAGREMAAALDERLGERLTAGIVSAQSSAAALSEKWRAYAGGHPLPNRESYEAARAALALLRTADEQAAGDEAVLVIFLISGGGSAMLELPRDARITLEELRAANRTLVSCGANISEINALRRALSLIKGGGLSTAAGRATQVTLIISDTNPERERDVASGPTLDPDPASPDVREVLAHYRLRESLPASVLRALEESASIIPPQHPGRTRREHFVLLDNLTACTAAAQEARRLGYSTDIAPDLIEQHVAEGVAEMVSRLFGFAQSDSGGSLGQTERGNRGFCLISGGEFACPVRGAGLGGRNAETALRCAFEFEQVANASGVGEAAGAEKAAGWEFAALCAGTDGVDGNSPAAGAISDQTTLGRARASGLSPEKHLAESDAYTLFAALGDAVMTGPTGTNVRDLRILLARDPGGESAGR
jgi:glycerate 2-kinase